jgi:cell division protein FtsQ
MVIKMPKADARPRRPARNHRKPRPAVKAAPARPWPQLRAALLRRLSRLRFVFTFVVHAALVLIVSAAGVGTWRLVERHLRSAESFAIRHIELTGNQRLSYEALLAAAGLALGQNIFAVEPEELRRRIAQQPWVEFARVKRVLPDTFSIEVRERHAVAMLALRELHLVSDDGLAFKTLEPGDPYDLPVISGIDATLLTQDERACTSAIMSAVALLHDYQDAGLTRDEPISEVHVEADGGLSLYVGSDAMYVRLGKAPFRDKLERLREVLAQLSKQKARAAYVYLDNQRRTDRVTARLR